MARSKTLLRNVMSVRNRTEFRDMTRFFQDRTNIIAEGDSWFAFPRLGGAPSNVMAHMQRHTRRAVNLLRLDSSGDEALEMLTGKQLKRLDELLRKQHRDGRPVHLLLFSGGGNDVAGDFQFDAVLKADASGARTAEQCFSKAKLRARMREIAAGYRRLIDLRNTVSPDTEIVTHTYDYPYPDGRKAHFLGLSVAGPWLRPPLVRAKVPVRLQRAACKYLINQFHGALARLPSKGFTIVNLRGVLRAQSEWRDELHATPDAYEGLAKKFYAGMRRVRPQLPVWK
jgi:hypothetical protein